MISSIPDLEQRKSEYLKLLSRLCIDLGRRPSCEDIDKCSYTPSNSVYRRYFGSITNALKIIYPEFSKELTGNKLTEQELIDDFYRIKGIIGDVPVINDIRKLGSYDYSAYARHFGSWSMFLRKLGEHTNRKNMWNFKNKKRMFIAKDGHICRSQKEKEIDDLLFLEGIEHKPECYYPFDSCYNPNGRKRCDWLINGVYVEYAGMLSYYNIGARNRYRKLLDKKTNMCLKNGWNFIVLTPDTKENLRRDILEEFKG